MLEPETARSPILPDGKGSNWAKLSTLVMFKEPVIV